MSEILEILAPAGDLETLKIAINSGADAVYLGANKFSARANAKNFSLSELKSAVEYAHLFGAKVYLTVNTILKNSEMQQVLELVKNAVEIGVDAFLIQDMGLASLLQQNFKGIQLHASTQLAIHNLQGATVLEKLGFSRVVLSREASLQDIVDIKKNTKLEIEYFVHGALCVGFSGNCYFSSICSNQSGNRGKCKQYCRLPYTAYEGNEKIKSGFLLSPSDQCLASKMQQLVSAGVNSFKIEGRLKKPSYVASAVSTYKTALSGGDIKQKVSELKQIYSRGEYNTGKYLELENDNIINCTYNNHCGRKIGVVKSVEKFKNIYKIEVASTQNINVGDALKFYYDKKEICSLGVGNIEKKGSNFILFSKNKPAVNSDVHLIVDSKLENRLVEAKRKLDCNMHLFAFAGSPAMLEVECNNEKVQVVTEEVLEKAKTSKIEFENVKQSLSKLTDTVFQLKNFTMDCDDVFIAKSVLNDLRRKAVMQLKNLILSKRKPKVEFIKSEFKERFCSEKQNYLLVDSPKQITNNQYAYILAMPDFEEKTLREAVETAKKIGTKLYLDLPNQARHLDMQIIERVISGFDGEDFGLVANNLYAFYFKDRFEIVAGIGLNIINKFSKTFYLQLGASDAIYSIESNIADISSDCVVYTKGYPVLMTLTHCPFKMLYNTTCQECSYRQNVIYKAQDGRNFALRRRTIGSCYFELVDGYFIDNKKCHNCRTLYDLRTPFKVPKKITKGMIDKEI